MTSDADAAAYGDRHAPVYDRIYPPRSSAEPAVEVLTRAGADGGVLELGLGTGRLALPLVRRGVRVDGIEGSPRMVEQLQGRPDGNRVGTFVADLTDFALPRRDYGAAVCAVSTLFMLRPDAQRSCIASTARHLRPGGRLFIEAFRFNASRFDDRGERVETRRTARGLDIVRSVHDSRSRSIEITHRLIDELTEQSYSVRLFYRSFDELDDMAAAAGLQLIARWHDWMGEPVTAESPDPISVYEHAAPTRG